MNLSVFNTNPQFGGIAKEPSVWKDFLSGDKEALNHIYSTYFGGLYNYGMKIYHDSLLIEDSIQDIFIELLQQRPQITNEVKNIKYYLYKCLRRNILNKLMGKAPGFEVTEFPGFDIEICHNSNYRQYSAPQGNRERVAKLIGTLSPQEKEAVFLIYFDELSYSETASIMCLKIKTVYTLVRKAVKKLRGRKSDFWQLTALFS